MNTLVVPPSPNWYESSILACAPDNTVIYGSRNDLVIIENSDVSNQASNVRIISRAHSQKILAVHINKNWGKPNKYVVSLSEDKIIKVWNVETLKKLGSHNEHLAHGKVVGANFAGDDKIISVSEEGVIVVWNIGANKTSVLKDVFGFKVTVTCLSTCPHASWLTAFGLKSGLVVVTDLRKTGTLLHKLRGHEKSVLSLSWCPAPINIFPKNPRNTVGVKREITTDLKNASLPSINNSSQCSEAATEGRKDTHPLLEVYDSNEDFCQVFLNLKDKMVSPQEDGSENDAEDILKLKVTISDDKLIPTETATKDDSQHIDSENLTASLVEVSDCNIKEFLKECEDLESKIEEVTEENNVLVAATSKFANPFRILCSDIPIGQIPHEVEGLKEGIAQDLGEDKSTDEVVSETLTNYTEECRNIDHNQISTDEIISETLADANYTEECRIVDQTKIIAAVVDIGSETEEKRCVGDSPEINKDNLVDSKKTCHEVGREIMKEAAEEERPRKEFLLASSAREGNIYIWRAGTDGRMQTFMSVPNIKSSHRKTSFEKIWITLCWASPTTLLSSSKSYELLQWNLPKPMDKSKHVTLVHNDHNTMLFSIAAPISFTNEFNWLENKQMNAWTLGQDRYLLNTSLNSEKTNLASFPTFGGTIHCSQLSPVDPNRLAIGSADGHIKVWDLSRPHVKQIIMTTFYQKIQSKVESIAWHPENELLLAFGTTEGRVGYLDSNNTSKSPVTLPHFFKSPVYKLEWGPMNGNKKEFSLYAVAEGKLVVFDTSKKTHSDPVEINRPEKTTIYSFAWKPDYSMLLVSTKTGFLIVYSPELKILRKHYFPQRIQEIMWHPNAVRGESAQAQSCWFAAITNIKNVTVYDFDESEHANDDDRVVASYEGAGDVVTCFSWSPHRDFELVIGNENGIVQIWDTKTKNIISTYVNPNFNGIMTVLWSPVDPDFMITSSRDSALRIWRISEHAPKDETELMEERKAVLRKLASESVDLLPKTKKKLQDPVAVKNPNKNALLPKFPTAVSQPVVGDLRKLLQWKEDPDSVELYTGNSSQLDVFSVFGTNKDMLKLVNLNETVHKENGKNSLNAMLCMFRGDLSSTIKEAIDEKRVDPWIISLAPMVSPKLWQMACETYVQQLSDQSDSDPLEIVTYLLACHKVEPAINCLCEAQMFKEALTLAKCRCSENDVVIKEVLEKWAKHCVFVGNFEIAAQCFIILGRYEEAASVLFRRTDIEVMEFAAELAGKSGNVELHKAALSRYKAFQNISDSDTDAATRETDSQNGSANDEILNIYCGKGVLKEMSTTENSIQREIVEKENEEFLQNGSTSVTSDAEKTLTRKEMVFQGESANENVPQKTENYNQIIEINKSQGMEGTCEEVSKNGTSRSDNTENLVEKEMIINDESVILTKNEDPPENNACLADIIMRNNLALVATSLNASGESLDKKMNEPEDDSAENQVPLENNESVADFIMEKNLASTAISLNETRLQNMETTEQSKEIPLDKEVGKNDGKVPQNGTACLVPSTSIEEEMVFKNETANEETKNTKTCDEQNVRDKVENNDRIVNEVVDDKQVPQHGIASLPSMVEETSKEEKNRSQNITEKTEKVIDISIKEEAVEEKDETVPKNEAECLISSISEKTISLNGSQASEMKNIVEEPEKGTEAQKKSEESKNHQKTSRNKRKHKKH